MTKKRKLEEDKRPVEEKKTMDACAICTDDLTDIENDCKLIACGHVFHQQCIGQWLDINEKRQCPVCRTEGSVCQHGETGHKPETYIATIQLLRRNIADLQREIFMQRDQLIAATTQIIESTQEMELLYRRYLPDPMFYTMALLTQFRQ